MQILFGPYGSIFPVLGISLDILEVARQGQQEWYKLAVEMIARGYVNAGATMPTINAFFLRPVLHAGFDELFKDMLLLNIRALLAALSYKQHGRIALCLGPVNDCYDANAAPEKIDAYQFHKKQYSLCLEVLTRAGLSKKDVVFLHETIGTKREALGIAQAAQELQLPLIISFIVGTEGNLLSNESIEETITLIDKGTQSHVEGYSLNCCSLYSFEKVVNHFNDKNKINRIIGFYPNSYDADPITYESESELFEPNKKESIQKIINLGKQYNLQFIGGCCGFGYMDIKMLVNSL